MIKTIVDTISPNSYKFYDIKIFDNGAPYIPYKYTTYSSKDHLYVFFSEQVPPPSFDITSIPPQGESSSYTLITPKTFQTHLFDKSLVTNINAPLYVIVINTNSSSFKFYFVFYYVRFII